MSKNHNRSEVESAIAYIIIRKLMIDVKQHKAYQLGLIDKRFNVIRDPKNDDELDELNPLNLLIFKIRNVIGPNISLLFKFMFLNNYAEDKYIDTLLVKSVVSNRQDITRVVSELKK